MSRKIGDRILLAIISLPLLALSSAAMYGYFFWMKPPGSLWKALGMVLYWQLMFTLFMVTGLAMIWSIAAPAWVERAIHKYALRLALMGFVLGLLMFAAMMFVVLPSSRPGP